MVRNIRELPEEIRKGAEELKLIKMPDRSFKDDFLLNSTGGVSTKSRRNVKLILENDNLYNGLFKFNEFTEQVEISRDEPDLYIQKGGLKDIYLDSILGDIETRYSLVFKVDTLMSGIRLCANAHRYHPINDFIKSREWDGVKRVDSLFIDYLGAPDTNLIRQATRKWLVGAVSRSMRPGVKFELMPVLIGSQGIGKSTLCARLCPNYFLDNLPSLSSNSKDSMMLLKDNWIIEIAELSAMKQSAIENTKAFISTQVDKYRASYGRVTEEHPRRCVFIGTTNDSEFLKDRTGNRRFIPVECSKKLASKDVFNIDDETVRQVWAEAYKLYKDGETVYLDKDTNKELIQAQESHMQGDAMEDVINEFLDMPIPLNWDDYGLGDKRSYYIKFNDSGTTARDTTLISKITKDEIARVALGMEISDLARIPHAITTKISKILGARDDFKANKNIKDNKTGKYKRGFKRITY